MFLFCVMENSVLIWYSQQEFYWCKKKKNLFFILPPKKNALKKNTEKKFKKLSFFFWYGFRLFVCQHDGINVFAFFFLKKTKQKSASDMEPLHN